MTPSLGDSISVYLRKLLQGDRRGSQAIYKFADSLNIKDQVKKFSILNNSKSFLLLFSPQFTAEETEAQRCAKSLQSCLTLCDPMDCRLPGSSVHGIFQARVLEWLAIAFSTTRHTPRGKHNSKRHMHRNTHCNTIYNSQNMETTWMSTNRRMDKDVVFCILCVYIYIHNRMLFSRKKWNWVTCRGVDGPREFQTKWSKSEKDKY